MITGTSHEQTCIFITGTLLVDTCTIFFIYTFLFTQHAPLQCGNTTC